MNKKSQALGALASLALVAAGPVGAVTINQGLTSGVLNTVEDQDREAYFDVNEDGVLSVGDVFVGFVRMDDFLPKAVSTDNQVYAVLSNEITAISDGGLGTTISLGTTTVAGLRLEDITGDANATGGMFAVYDTAGSYGNLITSPLGPDLKANIDHIAAGTLRLVAGLVSADNFFTVVNSISGLGGGTPTALFPGLDTSITVGAFVGGLDFLYNNTNFTFLDAVNVLDPLTGLQQVQVSVRNGAIAGALFDGNEDIFTDGSAYGFQQCADQELGSVPCGFVTDADFNVFPVPEPSTLALMGTALLGMAGFRRRKAKS